MNKYPTNKDEVLRYLGHKNQQIDKATDALIDECMQEMRGLIKEKSIYRFFNIDRKDNKARLRETNLTLIGEDIKDHLKDSQQCILMAVTLGVDVDFKIRYYEKISMTRALILDACATTAIEEICDKICEDLEKMVSSENKTLTSRYSPGYGDLPIDIQKDFLTVLGAQKAIGLTSSSHSILIPRKSVTAIIGVLDSRNIRENQDGIGRYDSSENQSQGPKDGTCKGCKFYHTCLVRRKDGVRCGGYKKA